MRLVFMGTPEFAVRALAELVAAGHEIVCVYSQPPAPKGRGQVLSPSPVHAFAQSLGLEVRTPGSMKDPDAIAGFRALDIDAAVVVAYGQILKKEVLEHPPLGCFNLHASLLPRWRGAAPIQRAIMAGDAFTGVEVMRMSEGLDEGPVLLSGRVEIAADDTAQTLHDKLAALGASLLPVAWPPSGAAARRRVRRPARPPMRRRSRRTRRASTGPARRAISTSTFAACRPSPAPGRRWTRARGRSA